MHVLHFYRETTRPCVHQAVEKERLDAIRKLMELSESDVRTFHFKAFGGVYQDHLGAAIVTCGKA